MPIPVVTVAQMQALEDASARAGVSRDTLMENAGLACARHIRQQLGGVAGRRILTLIGPGSNGADGLVIARRLAQWGADAHCHIIHSRPDADPKMDAARRAGVTIDDAAADPDQSRLAARLTRCDAVIDAILGAGRYRPPQGAIANAISLVNRTRPGNHQSQRRPGRHQNRRRPVFAIDLPTGVHPDTAAVANPTIIADETLALAGPKTGIAHFPGAGRAGRITVLDIGLPPSVVDAANLPTHRMDDALPPTIVNAARLTTHRMDYALPPTIIDAASLTTHWMDDALASTLLPPRPPDAHKGTFGHLLIIAGSRHYIGAAALAAMAAHRAGAGLVTLATPAGIYPIVAARLTETIHLPLPDSADGGIAPSAAAVIRQRLPAYDALAIGCGMGASPAAAAFLRQLLQDIANANGDTGANTNTGGAAGADADAGANTGGNAGAYADAPALPLVIDADGLNNLARIADWPALLHNILTVLTPHPGEMATLTGRAVPEIQSHRPDIAARYAAQWGQTILLKGAHTIIATPNAAGIAVSLDTAGSYAGAAVGPNTGTAAGPGSGTNTNTDARQRILPFANPALAAGGAGDVLTGIIGALLAQGLSPYDAAALAGYIHGTAGEHARRRHGSAGIIASDLPPLLPSIIQDLRAASPRVV